MRLLIVLLLLTGCANEPNYFYRRQLVIPDSSKPAARQWIQETLRAGSYHLSAGKYEDQEDVIEQLEETATNLFGKEVEGLYINYTFYPKDSLTPEQYKIFLNKRSK